MDKTEIMEAKEDMVCFWTGYEFGDIDISANRNSTTQWNKYCSLCDTPITSLGNLLNSGSNCLLFMPYETKFTSFFLYICIVAR